MSIGECYVEGIMDGEALGPGPANPESTVEFVLI
jgi:hypothetical protein